MFLANAVDGFFLGWSKLDGHAGPAYPKSFLFGGFLINIDVMNRVLAEIELGLFHAHLHYSHGIEPNNLLTFFRNLGEGLMPRISWYAAAFETPAILAISVMDNGTGRDSKNRFTVGKPEMVFCAVSSCFCMFFKIFDMVNQISYLETMDKFNEELESSILAGNIVHFVWLDPSGDTTKDYEFNASCHFIPRIGDKIELGKNKIAFVKSIYHQLLQNEEFEKNTFFQVVTVVLTSHPTPQGAVLVQ